MLDNDMVTIRRMTVVTRLIRSFVVLIIIAGKDVSLFSFRLETLDGRFGGKKRFVEGTQTFARQSCQMLSFRDNTVGRMMMALPKIWSSFL